MGPAMLLPFEAELDHRREQMLADAARDRLVRAATGREEPPTGRRRAAFVLALGRLARRHSPA